MSLSGNMPVHVGVIMDGNGRWAQSKGLPRIEGHRAGAERAKETIETASRLGIQYLTLYTFSTENWQRPQSEVSMLMKLLELYLKKEMSGLMKQGIVFKTIGEIWRLPKNIQAIIRETEEKSASNNGMVLVMALSYSGKNEIIRAVQKIIDSGVGSGKMQEDVFNSYLDTAGLPPLDLIIRTSGERRLSNFLLWQSAYAELYFTDTLWPDFDAEEFSLAIQDFKVRERRFGAVSARSDAS